MLRHLGEQPAAERVEAAVRDVIAEGTHDHLRPRRLRRHARLRRRDHRAARRVRRGRVLSRPRGHRSERRLHAPALSRQRGDARVGVPPHLGRRDLGVRPAPRHRHLPGRGRTRSSTTTSCRSTPARSAGSSRSLLGAALLYHALNGLRIIIMDFWPSMTRYHRQLWYLQLGPVRDRRHAGRARSSSSRSGSRRRSPSGARRDAPARPGPAAPAAGSGCELAIWYLMRLTGLAPVRARARHFIILHFLYDPAEQTAEFDRQRPLEQPRLARQRLADADVRRRSTPFMGIRIVVGDYIERRRPDGRDDRSSTCSALVPVRPRHDRGRDPAPAAGLTGQRWTSDPRRAHRRRRRRRPVGRPRAGPGGRRRRRS